jgi:Ni/Co efflux regulator RcnB
MFWFAPPLLAQTQQPTADQSTRSEAPTPAALPGVRANQTGGGDRQNPEPHIYKRGEHISRSYGEFDVVDDWSRFHLTQPPADSHWVKYGENYLLVKTDSGLITEIVKAS